MHKAAKLLLLILVQVLIFTGCQAGNPLIGTWKDVSGGAVELADEGIVMTFEFGDERMGMGMPGDLVWVNVVYEVHDDYVSVTSSLGNQTIIEIEDNDHISMDTPHGKVYMERVSSTTD